MKSLGERRHFDEIPLKAFVISVIGGIDAKGLPDQRRAYANLVYDSVIKPALKLVSEQCERTILDERGDHTVELGKIFDHIIESILESEILVAVLSEPDPSYWNPNVFFELGVAATAGRPVLMLMRNDQQPPADIAGDRIILYSEADLDRAGSAEPGDAAKELAGKIANLVRDPKSFYELPFNKDRSIGRAGAMDRFRNVEYDDLSDMLLSARETIYIAGTTLLQLLEGDGGTNSSFFMPDERGYLQPGFPLTDLLSFAYIRGVNINVVLLSPENLQLQTLVRLGAGDGLSDARRAAGSKKAKSRRAARAWQRARGLARLAFQQAKAEGEIPDDAQPGTFNITLLKNLGVLNRTIATEQRAILTPYFVSSGFNSGPCIDAKVGSLWHTFAINDVKRLQSLNKPLRLPVLPWRKYG